MFLRTASAVPWYHEVSAKVCSAARISTNPPENWSNLYDCEMCRCSDAELNCVSKYTRFNPELMQLEIGISTRRYLPPSGTAGLLRSRVSGKSLVPCPPPIMTERTLLELTDMRVFCGIR